MVFTEEDMHLLRIYTWL